MKKVSTKGKRILTLLLVIVMAFPMIPALESSAAGAPGIIYAAAYQGAAEISDTTLPEEVEIDGENVDITWEFDEYTFITPYKTVGITGEIDGGEINAQVEVIPKLENGLVYFVDANPGSDGQTSVAYDSVKEIAGNLMNQVSDQAYDAASGWGRMGTNFSAKGPGGLDVTKKIQTGWYSNSKTVPLIYQYNLEAGTYTLTAGFYEWWNGRSMKLHVSGDGMESVTSDPAAVSGQGDSEVKSVTFTVEEACAVTMEVQNATGGEAPAISWFAVAEGEVEIPEVPVQATIEIDGDDVGAAAENINGLTYKGMGLLSGNSTSNLLMDYKTESPEKYAELLQVLFGGEHPLINHVKMEMGNDGNNSTGADACTMRLEDEEADVSRSPGFQLAADAKAINPDVKVSFLRWGMPAWVRTVWTSDKTGAGYEAMYKWYRETVFDAYEKYGYVVDYINPDTNETEDPDEDFIKWFKNKLVNEADFPDYMDGEARAKYNAIKIIASDENTTLHIVESMRGDKELYDAVDALGFHYRAGDENSTRDYRTMADVDDKEVWYSEGCATFSYTEYQENKTTDNRTAAAGTIGGYQSPLALVDNFIKSYVYSRKSHYIFQPAVGSFYEGAQYDHKEIISAREPWAGYIHYDEVIYMLQHFSKFSATGWENEDNTAGIWRMIPNASANDSSGSDHLTNESGNPSYLTLASPDKKNFSVIMVNNSSKMVEYQVTSENMDLERDVMEIWETKTDSYLQYKGEALKNKDGYYTVTLSPYSMVTLTTLDCSGDEDYTGYRLPGDNEKTVLDTDGTGQAQNTTDKILYADDYEYAGYAGYEAYGTGYLESRGNEPRYTVDFSGAFVVEDGEMKHVLSQSVSQWNGNAPNCVVGDFRWMNYRASVDVTVSAANGSYAGINIRQQTGMGFEGSGYNLRITKEGIWTLKKRGTTIKSGKAMADPDGKYKLALEGKGAFITAYVDGKQVYTYRDSHPEYIGRVRLGCDWNVASFDNLLIEKLDGYEPYATALIDNAADAVSYTGTWNINTIGSSNDWYRSTSTTSGVGSAFSFDMSGSGFALIGENGGTAELDISVDGEDVAADISTQSSNKHGITYLHHGLAEGEHNVTVTVKSGTLVLDAVVFLPYEAGDVTELAGLVDEAESVANDGYTEDTWNNFISALAAAKEALDNLGATHYELDAAYASLWDAMDGLMKNTSVVDAEEISIAVYEGCDLEKELPGKVTCTTLAGDTVEKDVIWDMEDADQEAFEKMTVSGKIVGDKYTLQAEVEVVPKNLRYFVSAGTGTEYDTQTSRPWTIESKPHQFISELVGDLLNDEPDAAYSAGKGWGLVTTSTSRSTVDGGNPSEAFTNTDKYLVGIRDASSGATPMGYKFTLPKGSYSLTTGYHEFYGSGRSRDMQPSVVWLDASGIEQEVLGDIIYLRSQDTKGTIHFTLDAEAVVEFRLKRIANEAPMFSWLAVTELEEEVVIPTVVSVEKPADKQVAYGTTWNALGLPGKVMATLSNGEKAEASVNWSGSYDGNKAGTYTLTGTLGKSDSFLNTDSVTATIKVTVGAKPKINVSSLSIASVADQYYTGKALKPSLTVKNGNTVLKSGTDYSLTYKNNSSVGKATITVTGLGGYTGTRGITFRILPKATTLKATSQKTNAITLKWSKVTGANGYYIYRATSKNGKYSLVKTVTKGTTLTFTNKKLASGKTYYYKIVSYATIDGKKVAGKASSILTTGTRPGKPARVKAAAGKKKATITWKKVSGASGYEVYRATSKNGKYAKVKTITKGSTVKYTNSKLKTKRNYYYKVRAYRTINGKKLYGGWSAAKPAKIK